MYELDRDIGLYRYGPGPPRVERMRGLLLLTIVTFVTWIGTRMTAVALPLVALSETCETWTTGLVGGMAGLPLLTVAWWGRSLRERLTSGPALAIVMAVDCVGLAVVPVTAVLGHLDAVALCVSGLVTGSAGALLGPAQRALVSDLADAHVAAGRHPGPASWLAWQDLAHRVSMVFAPPVGALLVTTWGPEPLLWCETGLTAAAALALLGVPAGDPLPRRAEARRVGKRGTGAVSTVRVLREHPQVAVGVAMAGIGGVTWFAFTLGLAVLGAEYGRPGALIAAGTSGYGLASVIMSLFVPVVIDRVPRMVAMAGSWTVLGAVFMLLPAAGINLVSIGMIAAVGGAATPWGIAALNAVISEQTDGATRRAAFTIENVVHSGGTSVGLLAGGALIGWVGAVPILIVAGILQVLAGLTGSVWHMNSRHRPDHAPVSIEGP